MKHESGWRRSPVSSLLALVLTLSAQAGESTDVTTHHTGFFNGKTIHYAAAVESMDVVNAAGQPGAKVVSFAYWKEGGDSDPARPVIFAFNGGPISPSLYLHLGVLGPKRIAVPADLDAPTSAYRFIDNSYSPLDVADLVFFDPASTGFSRVLSGATAKDYFSVKADGQQTAAFIYGWLSRHGRLHSSIYILGESYGTLRAVETAAQLNEMAQPLSVDGVVLMGQAVNIVEYVQRRQNIMSYVVSLPTLAAIAWYHNKIDRQGRGLEQFMDQARSFAEHEYLPALFKGNQLPIVQRDQIAQSLQQFSGIPAAYYQQHQLRITKQEFRRELLKDQSLLVGETDGRYTAPAGQNEDPAHRILTPFEGYFLDYVHHHLNYKSDDNYVIDSPVKGLDDWNWGASGPFSDWPYAERIAGLFKGNPRFHLLLANGYFDLQTTVAAAELAAREASWPPERTSLKAYPGGHMSYTIEDSARRFTDDLRTFVTSKP
jgi:carboxypeptidase C (cathepsin A)